MKKLYFLFFFILLACSHRPTVVDGKKVQQKADGLAPLDAKNLPYIKNEKVALGQITLVEFPHSSYLKKPELKCGKKKQTLFRFEGILKAYLTESYFSKRKKYQCYLTDKELGLYYIVNVKVVKYRYPFEKLNVPKKKVILSKKDLERVKKEQEVLRKVYAKSHPSPLFYDGFDYPLRSKITSFYGSQRIFNDLRKSQHLGTDFRAQIGTKIKLANRGKVVFTGDLFFSGKTVIIDHGIGIYTVYAHLSKILANVGTILPKYEVVGLSGMTGRVSGPHLHWGVRIGKNLVDGITLVKVGI